MEKSGLDALFRSLPGDAAVGQDSPALRSWFSELLHRCLKTDEFDHALSAARSFVPGPRNPVFNTPLVVTDSHRLSLLGIHPLKPIPLHDHPNAWGAQLVLSGRVLVRQYDTDTDVSGGSALTYLQAVSQQELGTEAIGTVIPDAGNIHGLAATADHTVLLSIQQPSRDGTGQSWFFPVDPLRRNEPRVLCHRVKKTARANVGRAEHIVTHISGKRYFSHRDPEAQGIGSSLDPAPG